MQQNCFLNFHGTEIFWNYLLTSIGDICWYFEGRPVSTVFIRCFDLNFLLWRFFDILRDFLLSSPLGLFPFILLSLVAYVLISSVGFFQSLVDLCFSWFYPICRKKGWFSWSVLVLLFVTWWVICLGVFLFMNTLHVHLCKKLFLYFSLY